MAHIEVEARLIGILHAFASRGKYKIDLEEPATVTGLIQKLEETLDPQFRTRVIDLELGDPQPNTLILVNDKEIFLLDGFDTKLKKGDIVTIIPVSHGG